MAAKKPRSIRDRTPNRLIRRLRKKASPYRRYLIRLAVFLLVAFVSYSFLGGEYGFLNLMRMERQRSLLEEEKRQLTAEIVNLEQKLERLQADTLYIQRLARENYGLAKDDEVIIRIPENFSYQPE